MSSTKQKVIDAASFLFFQKGFNGTSVRDIAHRASVNVSLISYYFKSKQGLLEYAVTNYYENYLQALEQVIQEYESLSPAKKLKKLVFVIIQYKQKNHQLSCFIHRELSLDTLFVREMTITYLAKENHLLRKIFFEVVPQTSGQIIHHKFLFMQFKGMLITPYMMHHEWKDQVMDEYSHQLFAKRYIQTIHQWLDFVMMEYVVNQEQV
ncbi:MAG TPA: forespore capture DNA-binding protein RefZ [Bacillota bacterium]|nr:forespore capture DNA-binding protein RefZ [Bacillota bacterium]